jgi:hypothetical protein
MSADVERLLREAIGNHLSYWYDLDARIAEHVLAVRIPQECQTCKGSGKVMDDATSEYGSAGIGHYVENPCPDCPTILTLLLWGWNVAKATPFNNWLDDLGRGYMQGRNDLLAALREVPT